MRLPEIIVLPVGTMYWWNRSDEELRSMRRRDVAAGRFLNSAGETIIYSAVGCELTKDATMFAIKKRRGFRWKGWWRRPRHLLLGIATIEGIPREVMVRDPSKERKTR